MMASDLPEQKPESALPPRHQTTDDAAAENYQATSKAFGDAYTLGMNFIVAVLVTGAGGYGLDVWLGTLPLFMLLGGFLGFAAGIWQISKVMLKKD